MCEINFFDDVHRLLENPRTFRTYSFMNCSKGPNKRTHERKWGYKLFKCITIEVNYSQFTFIFNDIFHHVQSKRIETNTHRVCAATLQRGKHTATKEGQQIKCSICLINFLIKSITKAITWLCIALTHSACIG